jgi:hypothetical protein
MDETKTCEHCGAVFGRQRQASGRLYDRAKFLQRRFCSDECARQVVNQPKTDIERFETYALKGGPDDCWPWTGQIGENGYGKVKNSPEHVQAHRLAWAVHHGTIPKGLFVLHRCDNPPCCNPRHLFLGTHLDNMRDMREKQRQYAVFVTHGGEQLPLSEAAKRAGISPAIAAYRRKKGWPENLWFEKTERPATTASWRLDPKDQQNPVLEGKTLREAAREAGISPDTLKKRRRLGWPPEDWFRPPRTCRRIDPARRYIPPG